MGLPTPDRKLTLIAGALVLGSCLGVGLLFNTRSPIPSPPRSGPFTLDSVPPGARVLFLGPGATHISARYEGMPTPFVVREGLPAGERVRIRLLKDGFDDFEAEVMAPTAGTLPPPLVARLTPSDPAATDATLVLLSTPPGADVYLNEQKLPGRTPLGEVRVQGGADHRLVFRRPGFQPQWTTVYVAPGGRQFVNLILPSEGASAVAAVDVLPTRAQLRPVAPAPPTPGATAQITITASLNLEVTVGDVDAGATPLHAYAVVPGTHPIHLRSPDEGFVLHRQVTVGTGQMAVLDVRPRRGYLDLRANPWARTSLMHDGVPVETPARLKLYEGDYTVAFLCPDGRRLEHSIRVQPRRTAQLRANCRP